MLATPRSRLLALTILLAVLAALFVSAGTIEPDPADNKYPSAEDVQEHPDRYVGDLVRVDGTVVDTEPLTVETTEAAETLRFVVENVDRDVAVGDQLIAFGTLQPDNRVAATDTVHRQPWETQYMYVVSFVAGLWVLARLLNNWTVDTATWSVVPRTDPLVTLT